MAEVTRAEIEAAIEEEHNYSLLNSATESSTVLSAFTTVNMGAKVQNMPALATRPEAGWVGESAADRTKPSSKFSFENKVLTAAEVAVIIRLNEEDLEDANDDLLSRAASLGGEAIGRALDKAVLFGVNKPASWTAPDLFTSATAGGNLFQIDNTPGANDLVGSVFQAAGAVDDSGANPDRFLARNGLKYQLANLRATDGQAIYIPSLSAAPGAVDQVGGLSAYWNRNNAWDRNKATALVADSQAVLIGVRSDISVKFLDQATVEGVSLAENDQVALRFRARYAYTLADVFTTENVRKSPVAAVTPAAAPAG